MERLNFYWLGKAKLLEYHESINTNPLLDLPTSKFDRRPICLTSNIIYNIQYSLSLSLSLCDLNMNKFNFVRNNNGVIKLPPGFRFQPTDEELVFQYLRRKIFSCPLPSSSDIIPEINLCKYDPWDLPHSGNAYYVYTLYN